MPPASPAGTTATTGTATTTTPTRRSRPGRPSRARCSSRRRSSPGPTRRESATVEHAGRGERAVFDRRNGAWTTEEVRLFDLSATPAAGRRSSSRSTWSSARAPPASTSTSTPRPSAEIHAGNESFGGNGHTGTVHIHTGNSEARSAYLEEVLFHEAAHVSLDPEHATAPGWLAAQQVDGEFISTYARDHPDREDVAETSLPWWAVRHRPGRLEPSVPQRHRADDPEPHGLPRPRVVTSADPRPRGRLRACAREVPPTGAPGDRRGDPEVRGPADWAPTPRRSTPTPAGSRRSPSTSSASVSTCVWARSTPPPENGWRGSSKARTGVTPTEAMETMALTIAHRLQEFQATHRGDEPENEKAD